MQFMPNNVASLMLRENDSDVELPVVEDIQNYTYVSAITLRNAFPRVALPQASDPALVGGFAALMSFDLTPDQPVDADIDPSLRYTTR